MPLFKGEGPWKKSAETLNIIANQILSHRRIIRKNSSYPITKHILLIYVGHKEHGAIMSLHIDDPHRIKDGIFLGCEVVRVYKDSYLHVLQR